MFTKEEIEFLDGELLKYSGKVQELLDSCSDANKRERLENRLKVSTSVRRKLENEKQLQIIETFETQPVMVIDDVESSRIINKQILSSLGFKKVVSLSNANSGLKKLREANKYGTPFALIVCDWEMPNMSGLDLLKAVRDDKELWALPFYLVSSNNQDRDIAKAMGCGASGYVTKPVSPADLKEQLKQYID